MKIVKELSVTQYANKLGLTRQAILSQINNNRLPKNVVAKKVGNSWIINLAA